MGHNWIKAYPNWIYMLWFVPLFIMHYRVFQNDLLKGKTNTPCHYWCYAFHIFHHTYHIISVLLHQMTSIFSHSPVRAILIKCLKPLRCWVVLRRRNMRKCAQIPATLGADYSRDLETLKYWVHSTQITRDRAPKCKGGNQCIFSAYFM